jgi:hypothetical protein
MPLKTYFQTFVRQSSEDQRSNVEDKEGQRSKRKGQRSNVEDKEDQRSNEGQRSNVEDKEDQSSNRKDQRSNVEDEEDQRSNSKGQPLIVDDEDDQTSNLYEEGQKLKSLFKNKRSTKNKDDQSLKNKDQTSIDEDKDQSVKPKGQSKRKRQNSNLHIEDQRSKRLSEDQSIPMDNLEIIDFVSSNTNEQLLTSLNCSSDKSPVAKSPITQLSSENDSKHEKLATLKTYNKNRKSNKLTFPKATDQNYTSDQMYQTNVITVKQEIKKEREEEEDTSDTNTKTQNNEMSLTNCPNTSDEEMSTEDTSSFSSDSNTTSQNDSLTNCPNTSNEEMSTENTLSFSSDSNTTSQNNQMSLTICQNTSDDEMTFEESPLFLSSIKVEESQIVEFPSFSDESQNDTSMETSGKFIDKLDK